MRRSTVAKSLELRRKAKIHRTKGSVVCIRAFGAVDCGLDVSRRGGVGCNST